MDHKGSATSLEDDDRPIELPISTREPRSIKSKVCEAIEVFEPRDPRFDPRCSGSNEVRHFIRNYSFIDDVRNNEIRELEIALRKENDSEKKSKIKSTILRIKNKMVEQRNKSHKMDLVKEMKASKGKQGDKFKNVKKSDIKKNLIVNKFKELKESGKLTKYLERKRKKLINRDGKAFS